MKIMWTRMTMRSHFSVLGLMVLMEDGSFSSSEKHVQQYTFKLQPHLKLLKSRTKYIYPSLFLNAIRFSCHKFSKILCVVKSFISSHSHRYGIQLDRRDSRA